MQYALLRDFGSVASPVASGNLADLGAVIYSAASHPLKVHRFEAPLFVTIEGSVTAGAGGIADSNITARACFMPSAVAPVAATDQLRPWAKSVFAGASQSAVMWLGAAPATGTGLYAVFAIGDGSPHPMSAPFIALRLSNSGTAYGGGTFAIHNLSIWG